MKGYFSGGILAVLSLLTLVSACTGIGAGVGATAYGNGALVASQDVSDEFGEYRIRPGYNYYYSGSDAYPNAILGLDKNYVLTNKLWKRIDLTQAKLKDWVDSMQIKGLESRQPLHGFYILDRQGQKVGIWYSVLEAAAMSRVRYGNEREIGIDTPPQDTYHLFDGTSRFPDHFGIGGGAIFH